MEMSDLKVPIIAIINGEGGSGGGSALAVADKVWTFWEPIYAYPEGFASILWISEAVPWKQLNWCDYFAWVVGYGYCGQCGIPEHGFSNA